MQEKWLDPEVQEQENLTKRKRMQEKRSGAEVREEYNLAQRKLMQEKWSDPEVHEEYNLAQRKCMQERRSDPELCRTENVRNMKHMQKQQVNEHYRETESLQKQKRRSDPDYLEQECLRKQIKEFGKDLQESIDIFLNMTHDGPIYVCTSCHQTMFFDDVQQVSSLQPGTHQAKLAECITGLKSINGIEWLCHTCKHDIYKDMIPKLSKANKVGFPQWPPELELYPLEETIIAIYLPFMTVHSLPVCGLVAEGQKMIVGNVIHVPNDIASTVDVLPRNLDDIGTIALQLKCKKEYKSAVFKENIRPQKVFAALQYLIDHSPMYKDFKLQVTCDEWLELESNTNSNNRYFVEGCHPPRADDQDTEQADGTDEEDIFEEIPASENAQGNLDTLLDENQPVQIYQEAAATIMENRNGDDDAPNVMDTTDVYTVAPGEGQVPVFHDVQAEYKCFPTLFCGQERISNKDRQRDVLTSELFKAELHHMDTRVCLNIPNIFWKAKHLQIAQVVAKTNLALRQLVGPKNKQVTAGDLLDAVKRDTIEHLNEGYKIFRTIRNSPPYFEAKKKELLAMCRQLGYPTIFFSLSSADTQWEQLIQCLGKLVDNQNYTSEYIRTEMTIAKKCQLVASHPAACSRYFHHRVDKFIKIIVKGPHSPFGKVSDFFYRVEFQKCGSPHIHGFLWVKDAPNVHDTTDVEICDYVDSCMSCNGDVPEDDKPFIKLQLHKHSRSCHKGTKGICRFGAPWPPMRQTKILDALTADTCSDFESLWQDYQKMMKVMRKMPTDVETFDEWLKYLNTSEEHYLHVLQSSITRHKMFLQCRPADTRVNAYMKGLLGAWRANHDIQFVLDPYHCVSYICDYMTKSQKGLSELIHMAAEEADAGNLDLRKSVRHIGKKFLNAAESPVQQCTYDILGLPITNST